MRLGLKDMILCILALTGSVGSLLFVDEFDQLRMSLLSFFALPGLVLWYFMRFSYPSVVAQYRAGFMALYALIAAVFMWGSVLLLNAVGEGQEPVEVAEQLGTIVGPVAHYRGPLGLIYRSRF